MTGSLAQTLQKTRTAARFLRVPSMRVAARRETTLAVAATTAIAVHVLDDNFLQPQPGIRRVEVDDLGVLRGDAVGLQEDLPHGLGPAPRRADGNRRPPAGDQGGVELAVVLGGACAGRDQLLSALIRQLLGPVDELRCPIGRRGQAIGRGDPAPDVRQRELGGGHDGVVRPGRGRDDGGNGPVRIGARRAGIRSGAGLDRRT